MSKEIIAVLDDLAKRFGIAIDWTSKNVTPYLTELFEKFITWELYTSIAWICICVVLTGLLLLVSYIAYKKDSDEILFIFGFAGFAGLLITTTVVCVQIFDIIECKTFPEKVLFDYVDYYLETH